MQLANDSSYGLRSGLFCLPGKEGEKMMTRLSSGNVFMNHYPKRDSSVTPNQGYRESGNHTDHSLRATLLSLSNAKTTNLN